MEHWLTTPEGYILKATEIEEITGGPLIGQKRLRIIEVYPRSISFRDPRYQPEKVFTAAVGLQNVSAESLIASEEERGTSLAKAVKEVRLAEAKLQQQDLPGTQGWHGAGRSYTKGEE